MIKKYNKNLSFLDMLLEDDGKDSEENDDGRDTGENEEADASHLEPAKKKRKIQEHYGVDDPEI